MSLDTPNLTAKLCFFPSYHTGFGRLTRSWVEIMDEKESARLPPLPVLDPLRVEVERLEGELQAWNAACGALVVKVSAEEATVTTLRERHDSLSAGEWKRSGSARSLLASLRRLERVAGLSARGGAPSRFPQAVKARRGPGWSRQRMSVEGI